METFLDIAKYVLPSIVVLIASAYIVNRFLLTNTRNEQISLIKETAQTTLPLRLQAYERLAVFLERIHPRVMVPRLYKPGMTVQDLQIMIIETVKQEFEYNLSQQIYVSDHVWRAVVAAKEQLIAMINQFASILKPEDSAKELNKRITDYILVGKSEIAVVTSLESLREEARVVMTQGM